MIREYPASRRRLLWILYLRLLGGFQRDEFVMFIGYLHRASHMTARKKSNAQMMFSGPNLDKLGV